MLDLMNSAFGFIGALCFSPTRSTGARAIWANIGVFGIVLVALWAMGFGRMKLPGNADYVFGDVLLRSDDAKMIDVSASANSALVVNEHSFRDGAMSLLPNVSMNLNGLPINLDIGVSVFGYAMPANMAWANQPRHGATDFVVRNEWWRTFTGSMAKQRQRLPHPVLRIMAFAKPLAFMRVFASREFASPDGFDGISGRHGDLLEGFPV